MGCALGKGAHLCALGKGNIMKRTWRALVGIGVAAVMVGAPLIAAPATAADRAVVVCKYVTTPGEDERPQVVIEPNEASLGEGFTGTFPYMFADAQFDLVIHPVSSCYLPSVARLFP